MRKTFLLMMGAASLAAAQVSLPDSMTVDNNSITWVKKLTRYCEGPAWEPSTGTVYFSGGAGPIWKIRPGVDTGSEFVSTPSSNGLTFDPQGRLVACQTGRLARYKSDGTVDSVLVQSGNNGITINNANDLSFGANGAIYFTDLGTRVFYLSPTRQLSVACSSSTAFPIGNANGIEWLEDKNFVQLNMSGTVNQVRRYTRQADGTLTNPVFSIPSPGADGGTFDSHGNFYVADNVNGRVRVFNANGDSVGEILLRLANGSYDFSSGNRGNVSNCVFGGDDLKTLYITGDGGLYSVPLKIAGRPPATATVTRPSNLSYTTPVIYNVGTVITPNTPTVTGIVTSYSITPTLPTGLVLNTTTGIISGTPGATQAAATYTVTASNSAGSVTATVNITVNTAAKPTLVFTPSTVVDTVGKVATHTPTLTGAPTSCTSAPTLPASFSLNNTTCVITGTPSAAQASTAYTITATNSAGSTSTTLTLSVLIAKPTVSFTPSTVVDTIGKAATHTATTSGTVSGCRITPALPTGLSISNTTCTITGTAAVTAASRAYTITDSNSTGTGSTTLTLSVLVDKPTVSFTPSTVADTIGKATIHTATTTGTVSGCRITPALPTGLNLSNTTCTITGTPTVASASRAYTITDSNNTGTGSTVLTLSVIGTAGISSSSPKVTKVSGASPLRFRVPKGEDISITVYDLSQRRVWSLSHPVNEVMEWHGTGNDGRMLPQGLYFAVTFQRGKIQAKQSVLLLRD